MTTESDSPGDPFGLVGETLAGRLHIECQVAEGGFGVVYRARQLGLERAVAVKVLKTPTDLSPEQRETFHLTFRTEAQTIARLEHPHIVQVHDFGVSERATGDHLHWMALEWLEGRTLEGFLDAEREAGRLPLPPAEALTLLRPVFQAMAFAHQQRVVHRDLKPANIFLVQTVAQGPVVPRVLDFGIAKMMAADEAGAVSSARTTRGLPAFSPDYAAPEQISYGRTGPWTDVHALGLIMTEVLTGRAPYADAAGDLFSAVLSQRRPTPAVRGAAVGAWEPVLARALSLRPTERHPDAGALLEELEHALPAGPGLSPAPSAPAPRPAISWRRALLPALGLLVLLGGVIAVGLLVRRSGQEAAAPGRIMLAVLPFENLTGDPQQEYFSDGLTEGMIGQLGRLAPDRLAVIARTSVAQYKGTKKSVKQIGRELGVKYVLECSVQRAANRVHIEARLISAEDQAQLWSDVYERKIEDVLVMQGDVARDIASGVRLELTPQQLTGLSRARSLNPAAYDAYLRGRYFVGQAKFAPGLADLQRAVELDPDFAAGYAALAGVYERWLTSGSTPAESVARAKAAALRALELDEHLAAAHAALAPILYAHQWDWKGAAFHFRRALELDPNDPDGNLQYGLYLRSVGNADESLVASRRAVELNPFDWNSNMALCSGYYNAHRTEDATRQCQRTVELSSTDLSRGWAQMRLVLIDVDSGRYAQALTEAFRSPVPWLVAYVNARAHRPAEALAVVERMQMQTMASDVAATDVAIVYTALGRFDDAFVWLEKAFQKREDGLCDLRAERWWDPLRHDPRFVDLIRRIGIPGS